MSFWLSVGLFSLISESRCDQGTSSSSSLSTCWGFGTGGQIQEPWTGRNHLGLDIALFTYSPGLVTAAFFAAWNFKDLISSLLMQKWKGQWTYSNMLHYVMEHHFHSVQDMEGVNTNVVWKLHRHCGFNIR